MPLLQVGLMHKQPSSSSLPTPHSPAVDLLIGDQRDVDGAGGCAPRGLEAPKRLEVLAGGRTAVRGEGWVQPPLGLCGDGVDVRVERHREEGQIGARPGVEKAEAWSCTR